MLLAINPGGATAPLLGTATNDPAFGLPAMWIEERQRESAQMAGLYGRRLRDRRRHAPFTLDASARRHAARPRRSRRSCVEHVTKLAPKLIEDVMPKMVGIAALQKVLQLLLEEGVHIRDLRSIVESLAEYRRHRHRSGRAGAPHPHRTSAPAIVQQIYGPTRELDVIALEPELERMVTQALNSPHGAALDPGRRRRARQAAPPSRPSARKTSATRPACWCPT